MPEIMEKIIDGKKIAQEIRQGIAEETAKMKALGIMPGLAVILVGDDPASQVYVKNKRAACSKAGIASFYYEMLETTEENELLDLISELNANEKVHGILVQLPLPPHIDEMKVLEAIDPGKDVDGFHPRNVGMLMLDKPLFIPCTPAGIMELIDSTGIELKGKKAVVVGRSSIVGKPVAMMLLKRHCTVTMCHSRTANLDDEVRSADILVAAVGSPQLIKGSWIKRGAIVIDVGINRSPDGSLVGDVDFESALKVAGAITPVPGGVGPMTIAMLMRNTVEAAKTVASC